MATPSTGRSINKGAASTIFGINDFPSLHSSDMKLRQQRPLMSSNINIEISSYPQQSKAILSTTMGPPTHPPTSKSAALNFPHLAPVFLHRAYFWTLRSVTQSRDMRIVSTARWHRPRRHSVTRGLLRAVLVVPTQLPRSCRKHFKPVTFQSDTYS